MLNEKPKEEWRDAGEGKTAFEPGGHEHDLDASFGEDYVNIPANDRRPVRRGRACVRPHGGDQSCCKGD